MMTRWLVILFCAAVSTWQFVSVALPACDCMYFVDRVATGDITAPFAYRVLMPWLIVVLGDTPYVMVVLHLIGLLLFFPLLWWWSERWGGNGMAAVALATVALTVMYPVAFAVNMVSEWTLWLIGLWLLTALSSRSGLQTAK